MTDELRGQCLCGAVRYRVTKSPKWCAHCHCSLCRRAHGAAFVTWFGVPFDGFLLEDGDAQLRWYTSSETARRGFCGRCGTPMFFQGQKWTDEMHIARATLTSPLDMLPKAHVYYDTRVEWATVDDHLPRYDEHGKAMP